MRSRTVLLALGVGSFALGVGLSAPEVDAAPPRARCPVVADLTRLVPEGARGLVHLDGAKTFQSGLYRGLRGALERDLEVRDSLKMLDACGIGLENIEELTLASDGEDRSLAIVRGRGLGQPKRLNCVRDQLAARRDGNPPWTVRREGCARVFAHEGKDVGFALDDDTLVVAAPAWSEAVSARIRGEGQAALDGSLAAAVHGVDTGKSLWLAWRFDDDERRGFSGSAAVDLQSVAAAVDLARGLDLVARLELTDADAATKLRDELIGYRDMVGGLGVIPAELAARLAIEARDRHISLGLALSSSDLEQLQRALEPYTQGKNPL